MVLLTVAFCMSVTSCDDFLDQSPDERVEIQNLDQVKQLLCSAYPTANYGWLCEISSDNVCDINAPYLATQSSGNEILVHYNLNSYSRMDDELYKFEPVKSSTGSDSPSEVWESFYYSIAVVNHALAVLEEIRTQEGKTVDEMSKEFQAAYGEAYLIRAYCHFILVNIFSQAYKNDDASKTDIGVPYVTVAEDIVFASYDRSNVTETYKKIEQDLNIGLAYISDVNYIKAPKYRFNVNAAYAFAARFYLYKRDYDKVIEYADKVLGTDYTTIGAKLMSYVRFDDCTTGTDFAETWQDPDEANNIMLDITYSVQARRSVGCRYACAGKALRDVEFHLGPNWRWYMMPCASIGGNFWDGVSDHGFYSGKIVERFEYTDKVAGIGYAHIVRREFTGSELILERAEAKLLKNNPDVEGCIADLIAYEDSRMAFSEKTYAYRTSGGAMQPLTKSLILDWYTTSGIAETKIAANLKHSNVVADWSFTQKQSSDFKVREDLYPYMNCLNDMRRYETAWTGRRFFDLKRMGMEYFHVYGEKVETGVRGDTLIMAANDIRRAIEVPQEVMVAGLPSSYEPAKQGGLSGNATLAPASSFTIKSDDK